MYSNAISDIEPLSGLENLEELELQENYIDISEGSEAMGIINDFIDQGVNVTYEPQNTLNIELSAEPEEGGTVTGEGDYYYGETVDIEAQSNSGFEFVNWLEDGFEVSTNAEYTFTVEEDRNLVANFTDADIPVDSVTLNESEIELKPSETFQLEAIVSPENATNQAVTWESSNENTAVVVPTGDKDAMVVGIGEGTATVTLGKN